MIRDVPTHFCDFCGKSEHKVEYMAPSPTDADICAECIDAAAKLLKNYRNEQQRSKP